MADPEALEPPYRLPGVGCRLRVSAGLQNARGMLRRAAERVRAQPEVLEAGDLEILETLHAVVLAFERHVEDLNQRGVDPHRKPTGAF